MEKRIKESGMTKTEVAKRVGRSRNQLNNWLEEDQLGFEKIVKIGYAIRYDFSNDFPEVEAFKSMAILEEPAGEYNRLNECLSQVEYWKTIAYQKTDALQQRLEEILELQRQLHSAKEELTSRRIKA
ncbi:MAG: hypothetical protein ACYC1Q_10340 [Bacteroidia bacterium]